MRKLIMIICVVMIFSSYLLLRAEDKRIVKYQFYILSDKNAELLDTIRKFVETNGGYIKYISSAKITLRISETRAAQFKNIISTIGYINDEQIYTYNIAEKLVDLRTQLVVKTKYLQNLYQLFAISKYTQTLDLEKELEKVILQIENIKGQIAYYKDALDLSEVTLHINQYGRVQIKSSAATRWNWIRKLGVPHIITSW